MVLSGESETNIIEVNQEYVQQAESFTSLKMGYTYRLTGNVTIEGSLDVLPSTSFIPATLDLNGWTLTIKNPPSADIPYYNGDRKPICDTFPAGIFVFSNAEYIAMSKRLTLTDSSADKTGVLDVQGANAVGIYVGSNCILNIEGGTITNSTVKETTTPTGTGVKAMLGTVNMNGGSIANQATGIKLNGSTFEMKKGTIESCTGADGGGVLAGMAFTNRLINGTREVLPSTITMSGGTIRSCNATWGGGVSLGGDSDTLAAITGSIAEAFYGVPEELRQECRKRLTPELAEILRRWESGLYNEKNCGRI